MSTQKIEDAKALFAEFAERMNAWETKWHELCQAEGGGLEKNLAEIRSELTVIYDRFLTRRERKTGRLVGTHIGYPAEFDPANETIVAMEEIRPGKISIETRWTHPVVKDFSERRRYTVIVKNEECRIDKKEAFSSFKDKWVTQAL